MAEGEGFKLLVTNQSNVDRIIRAIVAVVILSNPFKVAYDSTIGIIALSIAGVLIFNVISGNCYIYRVLGINTCPVDFKSE